jgi:nucleolar protein 56
LYELASGYALFEKFEFEEIGKELAEVQQALQDSTKFNRTMKLKSFLPFKNAADALQNCNDVSEGTHHC